MTNIYGNMDQLPFEEVKNFMKMTTDELISSILVSRSEEIFDRNKRLPGTSIEPDLANELVKWRRTFVGQPKLNYAHAASIIFIRRHLCLEAVLPFFLQIWQEAGQFLCQNLNTKWLISACDTYLDHGDSELDRSYALAGALLMKTIKLYESELISRNAFQTELSEIKKQELFDGYYTFSIFRGDLINNIEQRVASVTATGRPSQLILAELFARAQTRNTAYKRLKRPSPLD